MNTISLHHIRRLHRREDGQLSILSLVVVLGVLLLIVVVLNVAHLARHKLETQNAADGVTNGSGTQKSRGMNSICAANHLMGEVQALVVLHHALGGDALDAGGSGDRTPGNVRGAVREGFDLAQTWCRGVPAGLQPKRFHFDALKKPIAVDASIRDGRVHLKQIAHYAYVAHAVGGFYYTYAGRLPYVGPAARTMGAAIMLAALSFEQKSHLEWLTLDAMERIARTPLSPLKQALRDAVLPGLYEYSLSQQHITPRRMEDTATAIGDFHQADGSLFPGRQINRSRPELRLPVVPEPRDIPRGRLWRSQLVRASVPWVHYWRLPLLRLGERGLKLSRFKSHYVRHTQDMTLDLAEAAKQRGVNLLVLDGFDVESMNKGDEAWTKSDGSREADRLFGVIGFARRERLNMAAPSWFENATEDGVAAYAQAMIYNANPQNPNGQSMTQAEVGWDTLNWLGADTPEWRLGADPAPDGNTSSSYFRQRAPEPKIRLNWQTMLVPSSRIAESPRWQTGELGRIMNRVPVDLSVARTH